MVSGVQVLSLIEANNNSVEIASAVTVSDLQFCSNKTADNTITISESFFIFDYLAKERLLPNINIMGTGFFTLFNNWVVLLTGLPGNLNLQKPYLKYDKGII